MDISFVIPVFNEENDLVQLYDEITSVVEKTGLQYEMLFVNDGSTDRSWAIIEDLHAKDSRVRGVSFRCNFGKSEALSAGFARVTGTYVFTLDADLQDNPIEIPNFLAMMEKGYDLVSGWKQRRLDPLEKRLPSKLFNKVVSKCTGVELHDFNCGFKCYRLECAKEIDVYGERHRFMPALAHERGFKVGELVVEHRARIHGKSKFGFERYARGFLDLLTVCFLGVYSRRPNHLLGGLGVMSTFFAFLLLVFSIAFAIFGHAFVSIFLLSISSTFLLAGLMCMISGLMCELIVSRSRTPNRTIHSIGKEI